MSEGMENLDRIQAAAISLSALFLTAKPAPNPPFLEEARTACAELHGVDAAIDELAAEIERLLPIFFSLRRHAFYPGGTEGLRGRITDLLLPRLKQRIKSLKDAGRRL